MKSLAISGSTGIVVGVLASRFVSMLPPLWGIVVSVVVSTLIFTWVFHSLRELREEKRMIDYLIAELGEARRFRE